jgi:hypothetical protein
MRDNDPPTLSRIARTRRSPAREVVSFMTAVDAEKG